MPALARHRPPAAAARQSGFSLIEVTITLVLLGAMSIGALQMRQFEQMVDSGRQAGLKLAALGDGAHSYARRYSAELLRIKKRAGSCEAVVLSRPSAQAPLPPPPVDCALIADGKPVVANAFQPTIEELKALGYVQFGDGLPFPSGSAVVDAGTGQTAKARWAVSIRCDNCDSAASAPGTSGRPGTAGTAGTSSIARSLQVMLYNTQPFLPPAAQSFGAGAQLKAALQTLGPGALVSLPGESPQAAHLLKGRGTPSAPNPLRGERPETGVPGVLAWRQWVPLDTDARAAADDRTCDPKGEFMCRDGTTRPTDRWDFNRQTIINVGELKVRDQASFEDDVRVHKTLTVGPSDDPTQPRRRGQFWLHNSGMTVNDGELRIDKGQLKIVRGYGDFGSRETEPELGGIRLPTSKKPGMPCDPTGNDPARHGGNLALNYTGVSVQVLVCRPTLEAVTYRDGNEPFDYPGVWTLPGEERPDHLLGGGSYGRRSR